MTEWKWHDETVTEQQPHVWRGICNALIADGLLLAIVLGVLAWAGFLSPIWRALGR